MKETQHVIVQVVTMLAMIAVSLYVLAMALLGGAIGGPGIFGLRAGIADYIPLIALVVLWVVYFRASFGKLPPRWMWLSPLLVFVSAQISTSIYL